LDIDARLIVTILRNQVSAGRQGQRVHRAVDHFSDCMPLPAPPTNHRPPGGNTKEVTPMGLFGKKKCGHQSSSPFRTACTRETGHTGRHGARGLK
jgi:hypothetical protein